MVIDGQPAEPELEDTPGLGTLYFRYRGSWAMRIAVGSDLAAAKQTTKQQGRPEERLALLFCCGRSPGPRRFRRRVR
jgi:hypothetical protein